MLRLVDHLAEIVKLQVNLENCNFACDKGGVSFIGTSIVAHCCYTTLPYHILLSIARYAEIYRHATGPCGLFIVL